jgi:feruloyl esterase
VAALIGALAVVLVARGQTGDGGWPAQLYSVFFAAYLTGLALGGVVPGIIVGNGAIVVWSVARRAVRQTTLQRGCSVVVVVGGALMTVAEDGHGTGILAGIAIGCLAVAQRRRATTRQGLVGHGSTSPDSPPGVAQPGVARSVTRLGIVLVIGLSLLGLPGGLRTAAAAGPKARNCSALATFGTAHEVTGAGDRRYCDVKGTHFEVRLPVTGWHGQYLQLGCTSLCGVIPSLDQVPAVGFDTCAPVVNGEMVVAAGDSGHTSADAFDGSWGKDDVAARVAFGRTSEHTLAVRAKAMITRYYGRPPTHSYFDGCSTGGRQALVLAQMFPNDFDGILAGSPAGNLAPLSGMFQPWLVRSNPGVLTDDKIPALHQAVVDACGDAEGIIGDPRLCGFDPATIRCPPGSDSPSCLTAAQVEVVRAFYRGPTDPGGRNLYNGGMPYGSELGWPDWLDIAGPMALNYLRYLGYLPNPPSSFTLDDVRFTDQEFAALNRLGDTLYNANDPNLSAFRAHGGKLILYHGWADQSIPPWSTVDYYAAVERRSGGFAASQASTRLYMVPGAMHCLYNGSAVVGADFLSPLISWVEQGVAPGSVDAPIVGITGDQSYLPQTVLPFDALAPVPTPAGGLNSGYDYIGRYR